MQKIIIKKKSPLDKINSKTKKDQNPNEPEWFTKTKEIIKSINSDKKAPTEVDVQVVTNRDFQNEQQNNQLSRFNRSTYR